MKTYTTREDLIRDRGQIYTIELALKGEAPEMPDKVVIVALARAVYHILDFLIRKTWGL
jgi:hypothetical protein